MPALRYIVPALAVAARAVAQCGRSGATTTIQSNADATGLSSCSTYSGSIAIATGTTDSINLDGVRFITGSLSANNVSQLVELSAPDLEEIGDEFDLEELQLLSTLRFPMLAKVDTITWIALPALQGLAFSTTGVQEVNRLTIINTDLASLDGINLQVADTIDVTNNLYLNAVEMQLGNISDSMTFGANGADLVATFPNLEWAVNVTFRNCKEVSMPSLSSVNGSLGFYSNDLESLSAPNLTRVGDDLIFVSNDGLTNITFPELTSIGGALNIVNNTELKTVDGFPKLENIGGAVDADGVFESFKLPALNDVRGAFALTSTGDLGDDCTTFEDISGSDMAIRGEFSCNGGGDSDGGNGGDSTNTGSGSSESSSAAYPVLIPGATGVLGVVAAIFGLL